MTGDEWPTLQDHFDEREPTRPAGETDLEKSQCGTDGGRPVVDASSVAPLADRHAIPGYELLCCVGRGGTSRVYRAVSNGDSTVQFAVKIYSQTIDDEASRLRFRREVSALRELDHPHIVQLHDYGINDHQRPYLVLQYIDGRRLDEYCIEENLSIEQRVRLLLPICEALQFAHDQGVLHRDLKPGNILVDASGKPYLTDFGLSKPMQNRQIDSLRTWTGAVMGTLNYMAPEQLFVGSAPVSVRTDVFGIGAVMHSLLTDAPPMRFTDFVDAVKWYYHHLPTRLKGNPDIPRQLEAVCLKCLAATPERRYGSISALRLELERHLGGDSVSVRGFTILRRFSLLARQYPWLVRSTAAVLIVVFSLATVFFGLWRQSEANYRRADRAVTALKRSMTELSSLVREQSQFPQTIRLRRDELSIISRALDSQVADFDRDPALLFSAAQTDFMLGRLETYLGNEDRGRTCYLRAASKFRRLVRNAPDHEEGRFGLFHSLLSLKQYHAAQDVIDALLEDAPCNLDYVDAACTNLFLLGKTSLAEEPSPEARAYIERAIELADRLSHHMDEYPRFRRKVAEARVHQAQRLIRQRLFAEAQNRIDEAIEQYERLDVFSSPVIGEACEFQLLLGSVIRLAARRDDAALVERYKRRADAIYEEARRRYPDFVAIEYARNRLLDFYHQYVSQRAAIAESKPGNLSADQ